MKFSVTGQEKKGECLRQVTAEWRWPHGQVLLYTKTIPEEYYTHHNPDRQNHNQSSELIRFDMLRSHVTHCEVLISK